MPRTVLPTAHSSPRGRGVLDYRHYLAALRSVGFDGPLVTHGLSAAAVPDVGAFLRRMMAEAA